jgi:hypothetical protein
VLAHHINDQNPPAFHSEFLRPATHPTRA